MDKEKDKKEINLMPEDLRSKEAGFLSKTKNKNSLDFDFVSPKESAIKKTSPQLSVSWWNKLKSAFHPPARFGQTEHHLAKPVEPAKDQPVKPKADIKKDQPADDFVLHMPVKEDKNDAIHFNVNYTKDALAGVKEEKPKDNQANKKVEKSGPSWWDRLKKIFASQDHPAKLPKIERVPERPIMPKELADIDQVPSKPKGPIDIWDEQNIKTILPIKNTISEPMAPTVPSNLEDKIVAKPAVETKVSGFYIPAAEEHYKRKAPEKKISQEEIRIAEEAKFHQPSSRARAKLLDEGGGVDLIPDAAKIRSWKQISKLLVITVLSFLVVIVIFYGFLFYQGKNLEKQKAAEDAQITNLERKIVDYKDLNNQISQLGEEIKTIHKLLSLHFYWTNFFQLLEKYTIDGVYYSGMTAGNGGAMTLEAKAASFETLAQQIKILQQESAKEFVIDVDVSSAEYDQDKGEVVFNINIVLNPSLFLYNENYLYEITGDNSDSGIE